MCWPTTLNKKWESSLSLNLSPQNSPFSWGRWNCRRGKHSSKAPWDVTGQSLPWCAGAGLPHFCMDFLSCYPQDTWVSPGVTPTRMFFCSSLQPEVRSESGEEQGRHFMQKCPRSQPGDCRQWALPHQHPFPSLGWYPLGELWCKADSHLPLWRPKAQIFFLLPHHEHSKAMWPRRH